MQGSKIDRKKGFVPKTPFLLNLVFRKNSFHALADQNNDAEGHPVKNRQKSKEDDQIGCGEAGFGCKQSNDRRQGDDVVS